MMGEEEYRIVVVLDNEMLEGGRDSVKVEVPAAVERCPENYEIAIESYAFESRDKDLIKEPFFVTCNSVRPNLWHASEGWIGSICVVVPIRTNGKTAIAERMQAPPFFRLFGQQQILLGIENAPEIQDGYIVLRIRPVSSSFQNSSSDANLEKVGKKFCASRLEHA